MGGVRNWFARSADRTISSPSPSANKAGLTGIAALTTVVIGVGVVIGQGSGDAGTANLWVASGAGTCTRSATPVSYDDSASPDARCGSFSQAYQAASCSDLVLVKVGSYGDQQINYQAAKDSCTSSTRVTIKNAPGETVETADLRLGITASQAGARHLVLDGINTTKAASVDLHMYQAQDVLVKNFDMRTHYINNSSDITMTDGTFRDCVFQRSNNGGIDDACQARFDNGNTNVLIDRVTYKNFTVLAGETDVHGECMQVFGVNGLTIRNSKFYNCYLSDVVFEQQVGNTANQSSNVTVESSWFGVPFDGNGNYNRGTGLEFRQRTVGFTNFLVRFNSFASGTGIDWSSDADNPTYTNIRSTGNLVGTTTADCHSQITYRYNVYRGAGTCSGTGEVARNATFPYTTESNTVPDYHLSGANSTIDNLVPTNVTDGCPSVDIDGDSRPANTNCDAGSDERNQ